MATNTTSTSQTHNGNGSTATFAISFSFLENSEVDVTVGGVLKTLGTHYNISGSSVTFTSGNIPPSGTNNIRFQRDTDISAKKVDFADGSVLTETDLDNNSDQILFAQQEITDKLGGIEEGATGDQTAAEIRVLVEAATDSNVFTDADHAKLNGIETAATADQTDAEIRTAVANASDSNVFTDAEKTKLAGIEASATADQTNAEIRAAVEAASDSNVFTDADHTKLNGIETAATADQTASEIKSLIASRPLDSSHLAANSVTTSEIADAELVTLAGMQSGTASKLADSTALTSDIADLNQLDGLQKATTITDDDTKFPTSGAIVDYVAAQLAPIGGFEAVANENSFPNTQPASGVVISIADAGGLAVSSTGTASGQTVGGTTVNISGIATNFRGSSVAAGVRFLVSSTGSGQNYTYHKATLKEDDLLSLSGDINDFAARYRVGSSNPTTNNDAGDLFFNTSTGKLLVYDGTISDWEEAQSIGNFFISTLSPAFDGSTQNFTITDAPSSAAQILLIIEGVVQKPNAGTSTPTEGFALDGSTVKLAAAPATGASYHAVVIGSTVNIGTPSNNTVTSAILQNGSVINAKLGADAVNGDKIADDSINSEHYVDGSIDTAHIANDAVDADKLASNAVVNDSVASNAAIAGSKLADDSITEVKLDIHNAPSGTDKFLKYTSNGLEWAVPSYTTNTDTQLTEEQVEDFVGGMLTGNTETGITVTYQDADGTIDFVVDDTTKLPLAGGTITGPLVVDDSVGATITQVTQSSATVTFDFGASCHHKVTLTQNATLAAPTNQVVGQSGSIFITQPSSGNYTVAYNAAFKFAGGSTPTASTSSDAVDRIDYVVFSSNVIHAVMSLDVKTGT